MCRGRLQRQGRGYLGVWSHALYVDTRQSTLHVGQPRAGNTGIHICIFFWKYLLFWVCGVTLYMLTHDKVPFMSANLVQEYHADSFFQIFIILGVPSHALYVDTWQSARHVGQLVQVTREYCAYCFFKYLLFWVCGVTLCMLTHGKVHIISQPRVGAARPNQ